MAKQKTSGERAKFVPPPGADTGGLEDIPDKLLPESEQLKQELNHAGLNSALPGEDAAPAPAAAEHVEYSSEETKADVDESEPRRPAS